MTKDPLDEQKLGKKRGKKEHNWKVTVTYTMLGPWEWHKYYSKESDARKAYDKYLRDGKDVSIQDIR